MTPTVGRIVHYCLTEQDAELVNRRRRPDYRGGDPLAMGHKFHHGNQASVGDVFPAMIVRVWEGATPSVNAQVFLDGNDVLWATSVMETVDRIMPGGWFWPPRVSA